MADNDPHTERRILELEHSVDGNGREGLRIMVDRHEQQLAAYKRVAWLVLAGVVAELFTIAGMLVAQLVKAA